MGQGDFRDPGVGLAGGLVECEPRPNKFSIVDDVNAARSCGQLAGQVGAMVRSRPAGKPCRPRRVPTDRACRALRRTARLL